MLGKHFIRNACSFGLFLLSCCFVFLLPSLPSLFLKKKETCILTLIKREKREKHQEMEARHSHARSPLSNLRSRTAVMAAGGGCACYQDQTPSVFHSPAISYKEDQLWIKWGVSFFNPLQFSLHAVCPLPLLLSIGSQEVIACLPRSWTSPKCSESVSHYNTGDKYWSISILSIFSSLSFAFYYLYLFICLL